MLYSLFLWIQAIIKPEELLPMPHPGVKCLDFDIDRANWTRGFATKKEILVTMIQPMEEEV